MPSIYRPGRYSTLGIRTPASGPETGSAREDV